jgi:sugar lactone lactonase YvrE
VVAEFHGAMPTGVTVSHDGRIFVCFPRWGDPVDFTVAEVVNGQPVAYPDEPFNQPNPADPSVSLVSVQSVVVDPSNRLWLLDTGSFKHGPTWRGGPKLVGIDLATNRVVKKIVFPEDVVLRSTYLNDIRFDLRRGDGGMGFITDASPSGPNGIIVVELGSGRSWRRLHDHPSTKPVWDFIPFVEGQPHMNRPPGQPPTPITSGCDGIAISADGRRLFYCPLASRRLYSVAVDSLVDPTISDGQAAQTVTDHGEKGASDGLEADDADRVYVTNYEVNAIFRRRTDGQYETVAQDPRMLWPDTLSVATDGHLYFTANQLHRQPQFHEDQDLRQKPYHLFRTSIDAGPVLLR